MASGPPVSVFPPAHPAKRRGGRGQAGLRQADLPSSRLCARLMEGSNTAAGVISAEGVDLDRPWGNAGRGPDSGSLTFFRTVYFSLRIPDACQGSGDCHRAYGQQRSYPLGVREAAYLRKRPP